MLSTTWSSAFICTNVLWKKPSVEPATILTTLGWELVFGSPTARYFRQFRKLTAWPSVCLAQFGSRVHVCVRAHDSQFRKG